MLNGWTFWINQGSVRRSFDAFLESFDEAESAVLMHAGGGTVHSYIYRPAAQFEAVARPGQIVTAKNLKQNPIQGRVKRGGAADCSRARSSHSARITVSNL